MRWLGALLLTAAGLMGGLTAAGRLRRQKRELEDLAGAMEFLALELEGFQPPMPELSRRVALGACGEGRMLFLRLGGLMERLPDRSFSELWLAAAAPLSLPARRCVEPLAAVLGRYGAGEQARAVRHCRKQLSHRAEEAAELCRRKGRLYIGLSTCLGAGLSVMLL